MNKHKLKSTGKVLAFLFMALSCQTSIAKETEGALSTALSSGKFDFSVRYRYEHVDDDAATENANASTIRTTLGYTTGKFYGFSLRLLGQDVRDVFVDDFNDATGRPNSKTRYAVVADPSETDLLESYLSYSGTDNTALQDTTIKLGRQIITYRNNPFHRFIGTVLWRQNWQNHDALTIQNKSLPNTTINYAYSWNVNRIFTDEAVISARANFDSDSHFINLKYGGFKHAKLEAYSYLLDFKNAAALSTATYGARVSGAYAITDKMKLLYAGEYATQDDYGINPVEVNEDYYLGEVGLKFTPDNFIKNLVLKIDYEVMTGNGSKSFVTPLATGHAYQGWTDRFLVTPPDGLKDTYFTAVMTAFGAKFIASYHMLESDNLSYDYGDELNLLVSKTFYKHYTFGAKVGFYDADRNAMNIARGGNRAADVTKTWLWVHIKF